MSSIPPSLPAIVTPAECPRPAAVSNVTPEERDARLRKAIAEGFEANRATYEALAHR